MWRLCVLCVIALFGCPSASPGSCTPLDTRCLDDEAQLCIDADGDDAGDGWTTVLECGAAGTEWRCELDEELSFHTCVRSDNVPSSD